jgi:hypothetical protein
VAYGPSPITPWRGDKKRFPFIAMRVYSARKNSRRLQRGFAKDQHFNVIDSSDNVREVMDYLRMIMQDGAAEIFDRAQSQPAVRAA